MKIGNPDKTAQVYTAIALQAWGLAPLKKLGASIGKRLSFGEIDAGNRSRIEAAGGAMQFQTRPQLLEFIEPKPEPKTSPALATLGAVLVLVIILAI